jgi:hypothetical protein
MALPGCDFLLMIQDPAAVIPCLSRCGQSDLLTWQFSDRWPENAQV